MVRKMKTGEYFPKKFLLAAVNAKYIHSNPAIYSLRAYAGEELQRYVELAEYTINQSMQEILADIYRRQPDVIGFSCYIWNWRLIQELLGELPKLLPDTELWLGGPEVSFDAPQILRRYECLSGIMIGEGEAAFRELLEYYLWKWSKKEGRGGEETFGAEGKPDGGRIRVSEEAGERLRGIAGLCLPDGFTSDRVLTDMTDIPFLYYDLKPFENKIIYYETSRGCPYRCSYCLSSIDKVLRMRDINVVKRELQFFLDNRVKQVKFVDRTFNCDHAHAMEIWQYILEHDNGVTNFHFEISADILREDEIALLNRFRPGLAQLEIGVQSVNSETIKAIQRVMNVAKLERAVTAIRLGQNIHQHLDLIAGLPYEDYESFGRSFDRVYHMRPEQLQLGFLKVLKGSAMYEKAAEFGIHYLEQPPYEVLYTKWLSYEEVLRLKGVEEMVELYYNSGQFRNTLLYLERAFTSPFAMYESLAAFYSENGFFVNSPARAYRFQVLLDFAAARDGGCLAAYRELLTYDMYLRENVKSRPEFAEDISGYRDVFRRFYQEEESERRFLPDYADYDWKQLSRMTHLEPFHYPVWDAERMREEKKEEQPVFLLFDYRKRDPLNYEAAVRRVSVAAGAEGSIKR